MGRQSTLKGGGGGGHSGRYSDCKLQRRDTLEVLDASFRGQHVCGQQCALAVPLMANCTVTPGSGLSGVRETVLMSALPSPQGCQLKANAV